MKNIALITLLLVSQVCYANYYTQKGAVQNFIHHMQTAHNFNPDELLQLFSQVEVEPDVLKKISTPYEEQIWGVYKNNFLNKERIDSGVKFYHTHKKILDQAAKDFGVPASIIVAILGVETYYGKNTGKHSVFSALATLAFEYPKRSAFFLKELENFLLLTKEQHLNPLSLTGSYAGAMGNAQFIPSSYRAYAINYSNSGTTNLNDMTDAIGSIANYFKVHGWKTGQPVAHPATITGNDYAALLIKNSKNPKPIYKLQLLLQKGIHTQDKNLEQQDINVSLLELDNGHNNKEYWLGRDNFYVISRYNHSVHYSMAVFQLSKAIEQKL